MSKISKKQQPASSMVTFYHDIEQNIDSKANPMECRQMVKEYLKLEKKYNISVTYNVVGKLFQEQQDLIEWILQEEQELAFHSYNHLSDWNPEYYSDEIDLCRKVSSLPCGYRSPRSRWNQTTLKSLWERGFLWNAEYDKHKEPYFIYKGLVRLPIAADDYFLHTGTQTVDEWVQQFSKLLKSRPYFAFGSHDYITSFDPEERLKAWEKILKIAIENKTLLVSFSEATDLFRRASLSKYYSAAAKNWNRSTKFLYRTKRFQEIVRTEVKKLNQPVIADLGSGGGLLSSPLKDIAKKIYLIDNALGVFADFDSDSCITVCLREVTDSNLPDNSIDLVICSRIIEYLFWPDLLAYEIKRIGKIGATYFVTFPALQGYPPSHEGSPPARIRRYFTPDEIQKWANQIGPGRLIGIQYERPEPDNLETEERYRATEKTPAPDVCPTNWVYIGTIQHKLTPKRYRETIPVSVFNFSLSSQRYEHLKGYLANVIRWFPKPILQVIKWITYRLGHREN
jgi:hypothetical protein